MTPIRHLDEYTASCPTCDRKRFLIGARQDVAVARICKECFAICPACEGTEYYYEVDERGYEVARRCPVCGSLKQRISVFNDARLPRRHSHSTLGDDFKTHYPGSQGRPGEPIGNLPRARFRIYNWVKGFVPGERGFLLHGTVGTGKTHLLAATLRHLTLEMGIQARFVEFTHLLSEIKEQFDQGRGETAVLAPLVEIPVLAIDELGKGRNSEWQLSIIDEIISKRYNRSLTTLFTTNYPIDADAIPTGDTSENVFHRQAAFSTLPERVGDRVYSRLYEMAEFIKIEAPDFRRYNAAR